MTKFLSYCLLITCFFSCTSVSESYHSDKKTNDTLIEAVCVWDDISVREMPNKKGKWLTSLKKGETLTTNGETQKDTTEDVIYRKVILKDGKMGWASSDFIIENAKPAVFMEDANIYSRPDLMTKNQKQFSALDIVAVRSNTTADEGWLQITGKRSEGKWIEKAWVRQAGISYNEMDMVMAKSILEIKGLNDRNKEISSLNELLESEELSQSVFKDYVQKLYNELNEEEFFQEDTIQADSTGAN